MTIAPARQEVLRNVSVKDAGPTWPRSTPLVPAAAFRCRAATAAVAAVEVLNVRRLGMTREGVMMSCFRLLCHIQDVWGAFQLMILPRVWHVLSPLASALPFTLSLMVQQYPFPCLGVPPVLCPVC